MSRLNFNRTLSLAALLLLANVCAFGQTYSSFSPYSFYGIGDLMTQGTAYNKSMGGVGVANRSNRFINSLNPAAVTARDSLAFMADFSLFSDNKMFRQGNLKSASNTFNINDLIMSFPIWKSSAMMIGIVPYSGTGYAYQYSYEDPFVIGNTGDISYSAKGQGATYQAFAAAGVTFFKKLSLGAQFNYIFGQTAKNYYETFTDASYNGASNGFDMQLKATQWKFGMQYEQRIGRASSIILGATYSLEAKVGGDLTGYRYSLASSSSTTLTDTLYYKAMDLAKEADVRLAGELGVGLSYRFADNLMVEFDYTRADWRNSGFDSTMGFKGNSQSTSELSAFKSSVAQAYRLGIEYVPNRNDIRYYLKRCAYRAGAYYKQDYFTMDGHQIGSMGITLGATLPIFRWYNGLTVGVELGQRGALDDKLFRERYVNFSVGINIFDIWFQKPSYE